jgi:hypothetical protein
MARGNIIIGIAVFAALLIGLIGLVAGIFAFSSADWIGTGLCLIASAISFGSVTNALLRR